MMKLFLNYKKDSEKVYSSEEQLKNEIISKLETEMGHNGWVVRVNYNHRYSEIDITIYLRPILNYEEDEISTESIRKIDEIIGTTGNISTYDMTANYKIKFSE